MKLKFIFTILLTSFFWSCKSTDPPKEPALDQPFELTVQHWFANPDTDSNFTERGMDITILFHVSDLVMSPEFVIFNQRRSFPPLITSTGNNMYQIEARIILESSLFQEVSERVNQTNRLVLTNSNDREVHMEFWKWETLPNRYD